jgi:hypothetical protein
MEPRYRSGEIVYANPARSPRREDDVIIQVTDATGRIWAYGQFAGDGLATASSPRRRRKASWAARTLPRRTQ